MNTTTEENTIEVGSILKSSWGYDQTNIDFYRVVKVANGWATIEPIGQTIFENTGWASETVVPTETATGKTFRRKIQGGDWVKIASFSGASVWNGEPQHQSHTC